MRPTREGANAIQLTKALTERSDRVSSGRFFAAERWWLLSMLVETARQPAPW